MEEASNPTVAESPESVPEVAPVKARLVEIPFVSLDDVRKMSSMQRRTFLHQQKSFFRLLKQMGGRAL